jgi:hypothetical protein
MGAFLAGLRSLNPFAQAPQTPAAPPAVQKPAFERAADALERVTWRTRTLVGDERLTQWKFAVPANGVGVPSFLEAVIRADAAIVDFVEGSSAQKAGPQIQKNLDANLTAEETAAIKARMGMVKMLTYRADAVGADAAAQRKVLEFAKGIGADTVIVPSGTPLAGLDALADAVAINVAILADSAKPAGLMKSLEGKSKRLGVAVDTGVWVQEGVVPRDALAVVKDRLLHLRLRDRSARGATARNVLVGQGAGNMKDLFLELNRLELRPLTMTLDTTDVVKAPGDLFKAVDAFEEAVQPAYGMHFTEFSKTRPIRWDVVMPGRGETLSPEAIKTASAEIRQKIAAPFQRRRMPGRRSRGSSW